MSTVWPQPPPPARIASDLQLQRVALDESYALNVRAAALRELAVRHGLHVVRHLLNVEDD